MSDVANIEERQTITIGGKVFYKVEQANIRINKPPAKSKHQTKVQNKIARPKPRGGSISMKPYSNGTYALKQSGTLSTRATTSTSYDYQTFGLKGITPNIER